MMIFSLVRSQANGFSRETTNREMRFNRRLSEFRPLLKM
jgi:hypothetical protein